MDKWEDRQNDWLAREMKREGYHNNRSSLKNDHAVEENSRDWNAGAISNAQEHEERHQKVIRRQQRFNDQPLLRSSGEINRQIIIWIFVVIYFIFIFVTVFS